jgi:hypothetical protein
MVGRLHFFKNSFLKKVDTLDHYKDPDPVSPSPYILDGLGRGELGVAAVATSHGLHLTSHRQQV